MLDILKANHQIFVLISVVAALMAANTLFRIASCTVKDDFSWRKLLLGLRKYGLILVGVLCIAGAGLMIPEVSIVAIGGETLTIIQALSASMMAIIIVYAGKCYENLKAVFGLSVSQIEENVNKKLEISDILEGLIEEEDKG